MQPRGEGLRPVKGSRTPPIRGLGAAAEGIGKRGVAPEIRLPNDRREGRTFGNHDIPILQDLRGPDPDPWFFAHGLPLGRRGPPRHGPHGDREPLGCGARPRGQDPRERRPLLDRGVDGRRPERGVPFRAPGVRPGGAPLQRPLPAQRGMALCGPAAWREGLRSERRLRARRRRRPRA